MGKFDHTSLVEDGSLCLGALLEGPADASVAADRDEHEVEDGDAAGQHVAGLVEDAPALGQRPAAWQLTSCSGADCRQAGPDTSICQN